MFPNVQNSNLQQDAGSERHFDKAISPDDKKYAAIVAIHIPANDERQMQLQKVQSDVKTQYRVRVDHLRTANRYVLTREKLGPTLGVIQTGSHNQRKPNAPTFEERSIDRTLCMQVKARRTTFIFFTQEPVQTSRLIILRIKIGSESNVSSPSKIAWPERINSLRNQIFRVV